MPDEIVNKGLEEINKMMDIIAVIRVRLCVDAAGHCHQRGRIMDSFLRLRTLSQPRFLILDVGRNYFSFYDLQGGLP